MSRAICEPCTDGDHRRCEGFMPNGDACACDEATCGANAEPEKETK